MSKREQILGALLDALRTVPDLALVERNRTSDPPEGIRPAVLLYDGDEDVLEYAARKPGAPCIVSMTPEVWGYVAAPDGELGSTLNELLASVQKALFTSVPLQQLVAPDGAVFMAAVSYAVGRGRTGEAAFTLNLDVQYAFDPHNP